MKIFSHFALDQYIWHVLTSALLLMFLSPELVFAQESSGIARVYTQPAQAVIKVNGELVRYGEELKLDTGVHKVEAWVEGYAFMSKEFRLTAGEFKTVRVKLLPSEEFSHYRKKLKLYKTQTAMLKFLPIAAYTGYAVISLSKLQNLNDEADDNFQLATEAKSAYNNGFWLNDLEENKALYFQSKADYEKNIKELNKKRTEFAVVTGSAVIVSFLTWKAAMKLKKPLFKAESQMHRFTCTPVLLPRNNGVHLTYEF